MRVDTYLLSKLTYDSQFGTFTQWTILPQNMQKHDHAKYRLLLLSKQRAQSYAMHSRWNKVLLWEHNTKVSDINFF